MKYLAYFFKKCKFVWVSLLGVFGFMGCDSLFPVEYGTPYAGYKMSGRVTRAKDNAPIEGIKMTLSAGMEVGPEKEIYWIPPQEVGFTNKDGQFEVQTIESFANYIVLRFEDVDGPQNGGSFAQDSLVFNVQEDFSLVKKGKKNWHTGDYEATGNIQLKEVE